MGSDQVCRDDPDSPLPFVLFLKPKYISIDRG